MKKPKQIKKPKKPDRDLALYLKRQRAEEDAEPIEKERRFREIDDEQRRRLMAMKPAFE